MWNIILLYENIHNSMEEHLENNNLEENLKIQYKLSQYDLHQVWCKCAWMKNANTRSRMVANYLSVIGAQNILANYGIQVDSSSSLQEISSIISRWDIAEVYYGDCKISIRINFSNNKLVIPKKQERYGLLGDFFMFVRLEENTFELLGFLPLSEISKLESDNEYYYVEQEQLKNFEDINLNLVKPKEDIEKTKPERVKIIQYLEGSLEDKISFFKLLSSSKYLREEMIKFEKSEQIYTAIAENEEEIKNEIEKDIVNISKLADAFIQSKGEILKSGNSQNNENIENAENFKLECARANLEKLFNSSPSERDIPDINNQTKEEVMDTLLTPSEIVIQDKRLPMIAVLKAFRFFAFLLLIMFFTAAVYCYYNYSKIIDSDNMNPIVKNVSAMLNVKKK